VYLAQEVSGLTGRLLRSQEDLFPTGSILEMHSSRLLGTLFVTESGLGDVLGEIKRDYPAKFESQKWLWHYCVIEKKRWRRPFSVVTKY
jgi:hypothetical protein